MCNGRVSDLTWLEAAISVGRAVSNPKMDGRYVTERERKFLIYRAPGRKEGRARRRPSLASPLPVTSVGRTAHCASDVRSFRLEFGNLLKPTTAEGKATFAMQRME